MISEITSHLFLFKLILQHFAYSKLDDSEVGVLWGGLSNIHGLSVNYTNSWALRKVLVLSNTFFFAKGNMPEFFQGFLVFNYFVHNGHWTELSLVVRI